MERVKYEKLLHYNSYFYIGTVCRLNYQQKITEVQTFAHILSLFQEKP